MSTPMTGRTDAAVCFALALFAACLCLQALSTGALSALNVDETGWETSAERCVLSASLLRVEDFVLTRGQCVEYRWPDKDRRSFSRGIVLAIPRQGPLCLTGAVHKLRRELRELLRATNDQESEGGQSPLGRKFSLVCACWVDVTVTSGVLCVVFCFLRSGVVLKQRSG